MSERVLLASGVVAPLALIATDVLPALPREGSSDRDQTSRALAATGNRQRRSSSIVTTPAVLACAARAGSLQQPSRQGRPGV